MQIQADERIAVNLTHTHTHTRVDVTHTYLVIYDTVSVVQRMRRQTSTERLVSLDQRSSESSLNTSRLNSGTKQRLFSCVKGDACLKITAVFKTAY